MTNNNCCEFCVCKAGRGEYCTLHKYNALCHSKDCSYCHTSPVSKEKCDQGFGMNCELGLCSCSKTKPSPVAEPEGWLEEFNEEMTMARFGFGEANEIRLRTFIRQALSRHNLALVEAVKAMKVKPNYQLGGEYEKDEAFNNALDAVIEIIKQKV